MNAENPFKTNAEQIPSLEVVSQENSATTETSAGNTPGNSLTSNAQTEGGSDIESASREAVSLHLSETTERPQRKRGRPPLKTYPSAIPGATARNIPAVDQKSPFAAPAQALSIPPAPFDEKAAGKVVQGGIGMLEGFAKMAFKLICKKHNCTPEETREALESISIPQEARENIITGGVMLAKEQGVSLEKSGKYIFGMGMLLWAGSMSVTYQAITAEDKQPEPKKEGEQ